MYLPGTVHERIGDLRTSRGLQQKDLAEKIGVSASQLSRIETGEVKTVNSDTLIKLAQALQVSTDYILGLTTVSTPKSYDISDLGLSENTVKNMLILKNNGSTSILNLLLGHKRFPSLILQMKAYFHDEVAMGVLGVNKMFELATASLEDLRKEQPEKSADIREGVRFINAEKSGLQGIDIEKIKNTFMAILRDIKKEIDAGESVGDTAPLDILQQLQTQLSDSMSAAGTNEQAAAFMTQQLELMGVFDEETAEMFKKVAQAAMEKVGGVAKNT